MLKKLNLIDDILAQNGKFTDCDITAIFTSKFGQAAFRFFIKRNNHFAYQYVTQSGQTYKYKYDIPKNERKDSITEYYLNREGLETFERHSHDEEYIKLCKRILEEGHTKKDRTGTGTISVFGHQMRFDLNKGFPLLTTKRVFMKGIIAELLWFLSGSTNNNDLLALGTKIWNEWAKEDGSLGPIYGHQWRNFCGDWQNNAKDGIDQIAWVINEIKKNPDSRRLLVSSWNPKDMPHQALPACHTMFQFYVQDEKLSCHLYQRSGDVFLGVGFNIASYALLTHMVAQVCDLQVGELVHTIGDAHIYLNHIDQVKEQIAREPRQSPRLLLNGEVENIDDFKMSDIKIEAYNPHPAIKGAVSV